MNNRDLSAALAIISVTCLLMGGFILIASDAVHHSRIALCLLVGAVVAALGASVISEGP